MKRYLFTTWALTKLFTLRYFRSKVALFFSILFPLILLFIFGGIFGSSSGASFKVTVDNQSQSEFSKTFTKSLIQSKILKVQPLTNLAEAKTKMSRGELDAIIQLPKDFGEVHGDYPGGQAKVLYDEGSAQAGQAVSSILDSILAATNIQITGIKPPLTVSSESTKAAGLTAFDYSFTGLIGFSLLGIGIFGPINTLPALKKTGALARMRTTPLKPLQFIIAYMVSALSAGFVSIVVLFAVALTFFHFHMHGNYLLFALYALFAGIMIFGFGMAVGGWANDEKQSAPLGNLVSFPMMFLSGIFFPRFLMPTWLQHISAFIPLSPAIDGMRMIATEGKGILDLGPQLGIMAVWTVVIYVIAFRVFRWE
jgi:ABC-2 type transport system permease protein